MNNPRSILLIALLLVSYLVWNQWQQDYARPAATSTGETSAAAVPPADGSPAAAGATSEVPAAIATAGAGTTPAAVPGAASESKGDLVEISNDVLKLWIDTRIVPGDCCGFNAARAAICSRAGRDRPAAPGPARPRPRCAR